MKHCMYCGTLMNNDALYCPKCGRKQDKNHQQPKVNYNYNYGYNHQPMNYNPGMIAKNPKIFIAIGYFLEFVGCFMFGIVFGSVATFIGYKIELNRKYHNYGWAVMFFGIVEIIVCILAIFYKIYTRTQG